MRMVMAGVINLQRFWYQFFGAKQRPSKCGVHHFGHVLQLYPHISTDFRPRVSQMAYIGAAGKPKKLAEGDVNKFIEKTQPCDRVLPENEGFASQFMAKLMGK